MTKHFQYTGFLIDIIDDLERNAAIYFPHFGNITGVELTSLTQRKHCEIAEVRVQFSLENIDLTIHPRVDEYRRRGFNFVLSVIATTGPSY